MSENVFVDTNVLIYRVAKDQPAKQHKAEHWLAELWVSRSGRLSFQVLQEYFVRATRQRPELRENVRAEIRDLLAWEPISIDAALLQRAWHIQDRYRLSLWDSLIVAAAKAASCRWLLTEGLQAGRDLDGVTVINPFEVAPDQLPA
jgi:predicted nucleic acid-binding protein